MDRELIVKSAILNAISHNGKADIGAVIGRVLGQDPSMRNKINELKKAVIEVVKEVNAMSLEEQKKRAGPREEKKERHEGLPPLEGAVDGQVVTRFAPAPSGPLHVLHAFRAVFISYLYARQYHGRFLLRLEDTDPRTIKKEFYQMIREDLDTLKVDRDQEYIQSDYMNDYYKTADSLIAGSFMYVCTCTSEAFQKLKNEQTDCPCRKKTAAQNKKEWKAMIDGKVKEGVSVVRFKTSMQDPNPAMRDPPMLRVVDSPHPLKGTTFKVWPLYNFANVVMDIICGVTHVFRGKEHEHNTAVQEQMYRALKKKPPIVINFGMLYMPGEKMHKRDVKKAIVEGRYTGWEDLHLYTIRAFARRGFQPEAIKQFSMMCGLSKTDIRIDMGNLEALNRQFIDPTANRYMVVTDPVELDLSTARKAGKLPDEVIAKNHPEREDTRAIRLSDKIWVSKSDFTQFRGKDIRLLDLCNVTLTEKPLFAKKQTFDMKTPKIQWVAGPGYNVEILYPDKKVNAIAEQDLMNVTPGSMIQMLRIGFARVEKPGVLVFSHK